MRELVRHALLWRSQMAAVMALLLIGGLFYLGRLPVAVGLLAEPWDKVVHASLFAVIAILLALSRKQGTWRWLVASVMLASGVGALDELHQHFLPGRNADIYDFAADFLGSTSGVWLMYYCKSKLSSSCF